MGARLAAISGGRRAPAALAALALVLALAAAVLSPGTAEAKLRKDAQRAQINLGAAAQSFYLDDEPFTELLDRYANTISLENEAKWRIIHPEPDRFDFKPADPLARWAWKRGMRMHGHVLTWHVQNPDWLNELEPTREDAIEILRDHIFRVVRHFERKFPGLIRQWDVSNEVIDNDGTMRDNVWRTWIGDDYVDLAFRFAREAAGPDVELFINDYFDNALMAGAEALGGEFDDGDPFPMTTPGATGALGCDEVIKCAAYKELIEGMVARGVPIDSVGFQTHMADPNPSDYRALTAWVGPLGLRWAVTEADRPIPTGSETGSEARVAQAQNFATAAESCLIDPACDTVVTWGVSDRYTWWKDLGGGALNDALPYTEDLEPKEAVAALREVIRANAPEPACGQARRPALRLPRWVRRQAVSRLRLVVVGSGRERTVREERRQVRVPIRHTHTKDTEVRLTGAVPDGEGGHRLERSLHTVRLCR